MFVSMFKSAFTARQNHFPINHALLSMEKSSFGHNFNYASKSSTEKRTLKLNGPLVRNWMKIVSFSAFTECDMLMSSFGFPSSTSRSNEKRSTFDKTEHSTDSPSVNSALKLVFGTFPQELTPQATNPWITCVFFAVSSHRRCAAAPVFPFLDIIESFTFSKSEFWKFMPFNVHSQIPSKIKYRLSIEDRRRRRISLSNF